MLQESMNDVPALDTEKACEWSLKDHAQITGAPYFDLTTDDGAAGPNGVKEEEDDDGGAAAKAEGLDYTIFDRYHQL